MSRIVPKLNLNKTPQLVENNSLIMAKNIRLLEDGTIGPDTSLENIETYSGEATVATVHHNAVTQEMKYYQYSILDCETALDIALNSTAINEANLNSLTFDFGEYHPEAVRGESEHKYFVKVNSDRSCTVYCYSLNNGHISWTRELFNYDINSNRLVNGSGFCLFLAVRDDVYDNAGTALATNYPEYFYAVLPSKLLGHSIELYEDVTVQEEPAVDNISEEPVSSTTTVEYHIINPVYQTLQTETVVVSQAYDEEVTTYDTVKYIAQIVGLNNKVYFFREQNYIQYNATIITPVLSRFPGEVFVGTTPGSGERVTLDVDEDGYITRNGIRIEDSYLANIQTPSFNDRVKIFEYDEIDKTFTKVKCAWKYSGGEINGCVSVNNTGEVILTICEYDVPNNKLVPIKHINLAKCSISDDESIYTQAPNIPITNLLFKNNYKAKIPTGVYQFFIRYRIREDFYTKWFPCSTELSTANRKKTNTIQGSLTYVDLHEDSDKSFVLTVEHLFNSFCSFYDKFQIGFILSHDDAVFARSWKHFDILNSNNTDIYFDYDEVEEINIDDLLKVNYELYNVKNIVNFKNKLYISNFIETDFNDDNSALQTFANNITKTPKITTLTTTTKDTFFGFPAHKTTGNVCDYIIMNGTNINIRDIIVDPAFNRCSYNTNWYITSGSAPFLLTNKNVYYLYKITTKDTNNQDVTIIEKNTDDIELINTETDDVGNEAIKLVRDAITSDSVSNTISCIINSNNEYELKQGNNVIKTFTYGDVVTYYVTLVKKDNDGNTKLYEIRVYFMPWRTITSKTYTTEEAQTLLPYTNYDFYCHFVKQNGIITNGYHIGSYYFDGWTENDVLNNSSSTIIDNYKAVWIEFTSTNNIPNGYVGYFISMYKHNNNVCRVFDGNCIECDTLLHGNSVRVKSLNGNYYNDYIYHSSGDTEDMHHFGEPGIINGSALDGWGINNGVNTNSTNNISLIKVTPVLVKNSKNTLKDTFLQGYVCNVTKLKNLFARYISGNDVYNKDIINSCIELKEYDKVNAVFATDVYNILSNYNLNYISLSNDLNPIQKGYYDLDKTRRVQTIYAVDSIICSSVYTLTKTFKDYTRKTFKVKENNKITIFNNTIRSSNIDIDEVYRNIFDFISTDYYNIPTHRGLITNLVSIANTLYVHCEHSLFKFTDNKTLDAQDEAVTLQENDIFNSGISEVFDAQYGYAGLKKRQQSLITYNAYVFYDEVSKNIYAFGGEQQIGNISESIKKLIDIIEPIDVRFVGDELHNRFFVNFINTIGNVCLSFNFNSKSFISVHDINFKFGFHTRKHTYFIHNNKFETDVIGWSLYRIVDKIKTTISKTDLQLIDNYIAYQNCYTPSLISINDCDSCLLNEVNSANACVDIIINSDYERIKTIDALSWLCSEILEYGNYNNFVAEESLNRLYSGHKIRIYTDSTETELFELLDNNGNPKIANYESNVDNQGNLIQTSGNQPIGNPNTYKYPRYDNGVWSMNYFRNIRKLNDIFNYLANKNKITGGEGHSATTDLTPKQQRDFLTQENSLIYGKYFVVRFIFNNKNFKLENIIANMKYYDTKK